MRKVVVAVLWRNSPAVIEMPTSSTSRPPAEADDMTLRIPVLVSSDAIAGPPVIARAMLTGTNARATPTYSQNTRVVRSFKNSARMSLVIGVLLRW
jgi:hypothetical protein